MISPDIAVRLRAAGLAWRPVRGDRFAILDRDLDDEVFVLSDMTIEIHDTPQGQVVGFNGTVEWALDDIEKDDALWLPAEDRLRELLGGTFRRLDRGSAGYRVVTEVTGREHVAEAAEAADAYGLALLHLIEGEPEPAPA